MIQSVIMKRLLLANFAECPENYHFERALLRQARCAVDIVHDFEFDYSFLGAGLPPRASRSRYTGLAALKGLFARRYDLVLALDFPKRPRCAPGFLWLLREAPARRVFAANHLLPMPGHNATADLARRSRALAGADAACVLEFDDARLWEELGARRGELLTRGYCVDTRYYSPASPAKGSYVFSAGSAGREFRALAAGAAEAGLPLKVFSDSRAEEAPPGTDFLPLAKNLDKLKAAAAGAAAVVVPVRDGHINEAAGNSIAFIAMALGRPVLARRTPYMERHIRDGVSGFLYDGLGPASVAAGLRRIRALGPDGRRRLAAAARRAVLAGACLDKSCAQLLRRLL